MKLNVHLGEDLHKIEKELKKNEYIKIEPFLKQLTVYSDVASRVMRKLAVIFNRLFIVVENNDEWSAREFMEEYESSGILMDEYELEGKKMNEELKKVKSLQIVY